MLGEQLNTQIWATHNSEVYLTWNRGGTARNAVAHERVVVVMGGLIKAGDRGHGGTGRMKRNSRVGKFSPSFG